MTERIDAERAWELLEAATPGPWSADLDMFRDNVICACVTDQSVSLLATLDTDHEVHAEVEGKWTDTDTRRRGEAWAAARDSQQLHDAALIAAAPDLARAVIALTEERDSLADRITTIADEACGMQPVQSADESLSLIERELFRLRVELSQKTGELERAESGERLRVAEAERDAAIAELQHMREVRQHG